MTDLTKKKDSWRGKGDPLMQKTKLVNQTARYMQPWKNYKL
jgi:hypothetical protein